MDVKVADHSVYPVEDLSPWDGAVLPTFTWVFLSQLSFSGNIRADKQVSMVILNPVS